MPDQIPEEVRNARVEVSRLMVKRDALLSESSRTGRVDHPGLNEIDERIGALLDGVAALIDPCDASETEPLVLLPVRLETRFGPGATLRIRIYPDEIHVDDLARGLTNDEFSAATKYWTQVWADPVPTTSWPEFVATVGVDRAEWVAHACTPTNLAQRGTDGSPTFPQPPTRGPRNVVARALPDRFVVLAIQNGQVSRAVGRPIPRDLSLSPIPLEGDSATRVADALTVPPGSEWLIDYDRAVEVGMAVTVTLSGGEAPIERVIAMGTSASLSPSAAADEFEDLLVGHRFGTGLGLLQQGTPTNNTDASRSPYRQQTTPQAPVLSPPVSRAGSDAAAAADALGIDGSLLTGLIGDGNAEQSIAKEMNTALWAPSWGEYLARLDEQGVPGVVDAQRESARRLFRDHVRGRGTIPTIRVGAQPYGVLAVSDLHNWVPAAGETTAGIVHVVKALLSRWRFAAENNVARVRAGSASLDTTILEILGSSPVMQGLRVRPVVSDDVSASVIASLGLNHREYDAEKISSSAVVSTLLAASASKIVIGSLHDKSRPLPLPLASERDPEFIEALLGSPSQVLPVDSVLQALLVLGWQSNELNVAKVSPSTVLPALVELVSLNAELKSQSAAIVARADKAAPSELRSIVTQLEAAGVTVGGTSMLSEYQPVAHIQTSLAEVALSSPITAQSQAIGASALAGWLLAMSIRGEVRDAMHALSKTDLAARHLAVAEALDCSSHRLDAWATAVVSERRSLQVARRAAAGPQNIRGLTIGAYGVVEDLRPQRGPSLDGWIHAPSTRHAIAAGMLRSSHLSHLPSAGAATDGGPFAIDLSSRRIQGAAHIIEGVRQGQQLGALVGYQIERGLAEARLARLQLSLRTHAPLIAGRLHDSDGADAQIAKESIAANNVVDGVLLLKKFAPGDAALRTALDQPPKNPFLEPGDWTPLTNPEWSTVTQILREASDTIDAVADLMLSESVLQFAGGNPHRAAAAMDAMSTGASPSDTIDILETQDSGERLTHRVLAVIGSGVAATKWNTNRPRARVEPRLEAWVATHLGDPANIVVADIGTRRVTLDEIGLCALDLVFATDLVSLERAIRAAVSDLGTTQLAVTRNPSWPAALRAIGQVVGLASTLRATIAGAHPLLPLDLTRPAEAPTRTLDASLSELTSRVTDLAASFQAAVTALAPTIATIPDDGIVADLDTAIAVEHAAYALEPFGVSLAPNPAVPLDLSWVRAAWQGAQSRSFVAQATVDRLVALPADTPSSITLDAAQDAAGAVFGDGFLIVPLLQPVAGTDAFVEAVVNPLFPAPTAPELRRFVRDVSTVRPQITRFSEVLLLDAALGHGRSIGVVQLSERTPSGPAPGTDRWLAGTLPPDGPWPATPVAHVVLDQIGTVNSAASLAGLVIDAWVEDLPARVGPNADPADPRPGRARTGLAVRCNTASARPPQAVLCAVSPDGKRWTTESLRGVIEQTLELAKVRLVTLERLLGDGLVLPALYTRSSSLQGQKYLDFTQLAQLKSSFLTMPFVKEVK